MQRTADRSFGLLLAAIGLLWPWLSQAAASGACPAISCIDRPGFKLFAPFTTMIVLSLVLSLILWLLPPLERASPAPPRPCVG